ncbi:MAG: hypothetical protein WKF56_03515 [Candidatus Limnocylindrales bacterium]
MATNSSKSTTSGSASGAGSRSTTADNGGGAADTARDLAGAAMDVASEAVGRLPDAAASTRVALADASRTIRAGSDESLSAGTLVSFGFALGLLVGGANRLLVMVALVPAAAMGLTLLDRQTNPRPANNTTIELP